MLGQIWTLRYPEVVATARALDLVGADALFISCTNVPTYDVLAPLQDELGIPVLSANQVTMRAAVRRAELAIAGVAAEFEESVRSAEQADGAAA